MSEPECVNLLEMFGETYKIEYDPAYSAFNVPKVKRDPWMMVIPCYNGCIFPHGGTLLCWELEGAKFCVHKAKTNPLFTIHQVGDQSGAFLFDVKDFKAVVPLARPRRRARRPKTPEQAAAAAEVLRKHRERKNADDTP